MAVAASEPTITDANVVLGYISPDWFNGGTMRLDKEAAARGIKRAIADPLGVSTEEAAWGIHLVATSNMENALRIVSVERGRDPRLYAMVAFGGAGPLHAARLARAVGIPTVIVPYGAGVGSAIGLLQAEPRIDVTLTRVMHLDAKRSGRAIAGVYEELEALAKQDVRRISQAGKPQWSRYAQMRYAGQGFEIHVDLPRGPDRRQLWPAGHRRIQAGLSAQAQVSRIPKASVEAVDWTLVATMPSRGGGTALGWRQGLRGAEAGQCGAAWFPEAGGYTDTRIVDRHALAAGGRHCRPGDHRGSRLHRRRPAGRCGAHERQGSHHHRDQERGFAMKASGVDPITLTVIWNSLISIAEELGVTLRHTAFSEGVREGDDFSTAIFDRNAV